MARPTKLTPPVQEAIVNAVRLGVPYVRAALLADVAERTAHQWRSRGAGTDGRKPTPLYVQFVQDLQKAEASDEATRILRITAAAHGGVIVYEKTTTYPDGHTVYEVRRTRPEWTADAWVLERSRPDAWGRRERVDMRVNIERAAAKVAQDLGLNAEDILAEAQALLREMDNDDAMGRPPC